MDFRKVLNKFQFIDVPQPLSQHPTRLDGFLDSSSRRKSIVVEKKQSYPGYAVQIEPDMGVYESSNAM